MRYEKHILLVEDNPGDVMLIREYFKSIPEKFQLTHLQDGEEAVNFFKNITDPDQAPHLVLLDLNLPKKSGMEVLDSIKRNERLRSIPVVMLTSSSLKDDIEKAYHFLANSYIVKPFDFDEFSSVIEGIWQFWFRIASLPEVA